MILSDIINNILCFSTQFVEKYVNGTQIGHLRVKNKYYNDDNNIY